jgi:hypothetical protein
MLHLVIKRAILIQQGTFNKNISVILLTDSGKNNYVCILSEKVDFA